MDMYFKARRAYMYLNAGIAIDLALAHTKKIVSSLIFSTYCRESRDASFEGSFAITG
jgi:hypothetical protein